jgi:hypothetical protein
MAEDIPSDDVIFQSIETQGAYRDEKSLETSTKIVKRKYKLAGNIIDLPSLKLFSFFVLTTERTACRSVLTVQIKKSDWENKDSRYLNEEYSYADINKVEPLSKEAIAQKRRDTQNRFLFVGKLSDVKFKELRSKRENLSKTRPIPERHSALIECALADAEIPQKVLEKLSLN